MSSIYRVDSLGVYLLIFLCKDVPQGQVSWYFSTATSLELQDWSVPTLVQGSVSPRASPCPAQPNGGGEQYDGWFPSLMSPSAASGHIGDTGYAFYGSGCNTDKRSFVRRAFTLSAGTTLDQHGLTGSWFQQATSGQGFEVEVFPDMVSAGTGFLQGSWFTFDTTSGGADHGRWYTFSGNVLTGQSSATFTLYKNVGGNFNAPPVTQSATIGQVTLSLSDCTNGQLGYNFTDGTAHGNDPADAPDT